MVGVVSSGGANADADVSKVLIYIAYGVVAAFGCAVLYSILRMRNKIYFKFNFQKRPHPLAVGSIPNDGQRLTAAAGGGGGNAESADAGTLGVRSEGSLQDHKHDVKRVFELANTDDSTLWPKDHTTIDFGQIDEDLLFVLSDSEEEMSKW